MLEYAPKGLLGVLTPQANTTVEAEFSILLPPKIGMIASRLTSKKSSMMERLVQYIEQIEENLDNFANSPLKAAIFACTGASYFYEPVQEEKYLNEIASGRGYPIVSAATAISDALKVIQPKKIGIISPYGDELHSKALSYWSKNSYTIEGVKRIEQAKKGFHPIYSLRSVELETCFEKVNGNNLNVIVILGTGFPTLKTILAADSNLIVISANLCLMWRACLIIENQKPSLENLSNWFSGKIWRERFLLRNL